MTVTFADELERRVNDEAAKRGMTVTAYVEALLIDQLAAIEANRASLELIEQWRREGVAEADPELIRQRRQEAREFFDSLARDRGYADANLPPVIASGS